MTKTTRTRYTLEFKQEAVRLTEETLAETICVPGYTQTVILIPYQ